MPDDYYVSQYSGEEIDALLASAGVPIGITKEYQSVAEMNQDFTGTDVQRGQFVLILTTDTSSEDYGKVYLKGTSNWVYTFTLTDLTAIKGPQGPAGPANVLTIGSVTSGEVASATITGSAPNQTLNLVLPKGDKGDPGDDAPTIIGITIRQSDYHMIVTLSDGTSYDAGYCRGAAGGSEVIASVIPMGWVRGDVNHDGAVDSVDLGFIEFGTSSTGEKYFNKALSTVFPDGNIPYDWLAADADDNGIINVNDLHAVSANRKNGLRGEVTGNWTVNPNYETEDAQFYCDIPVDGVGADTDVIIQCADAIIITKAEINGNAVRIYVVNVPTADLPCSIAIVPGEGNVTAVTPRAAENIYAKENGVGIPLDQWSQQIGSVCDVTATRTTGDTLNLTNVTVFSIYEDETDFYTHVLASARVNASTVGLLEVVLEFGDFISASITTKNKIELSAVTINSVKSGFGINSKNDAPQLLLNENVAISGMEGQVLGFGAKGTMVPVFLEQLYLRSSTSGSAKKFKLTVDDSGTLSAVEVTT